MSTLASGAWTFLVRPADAGSGDKGWTTTELLRGALLDMWPNVANQMIGVMGWAETLMPRLVYVGWFMAGGLLLLGALGLGNRTDRWRLLALFFVTFVPLLSAELLLANAIGWFSSSAPLES